MKCLLYLFIFLPLISFAQTDSFAVYSRAFNVNETGANEIKDAAKDYVKQNRDRFFSVFSFAKDELDKSIDTTGYGYYSTNGDTVLAHCIWIYLGSRRSDCVVLRGDVIFIARNGWTKVVLRNLKYYKYAYEKNGVVFKEEGYYKNLDICKHCNVPGIKLGEIVDNNFGGIAASYHEYLKKISK